jgi:hypothetical protein
MLLRIFLIVSILAGAGVIAITHFKVRPHVQGIIDVRNSETTRANGLDANLKKRTAELAATKKELDKTANELSKSNSDLNAANKKIDGLESNVKDLTAKLSKANADLTKAKQDLFAWEALGLTVDQVKGVIDLNKKLKLNLEMAMEEYLILSNAHYKVSMLYSNIVGTTEDFVQPMREGLKGKILVVDPKWNFVVLDIGEKDGALPHGVMMVSRDAKLVGKVKIVSVQPDRSIANIMPGWKLDEVMEGDQVVY